MKHIVIGIGLFVLQIYLIISGVSLFGKYVNPFILFTVSVSIPAYLIWLNLKISIKPFLQMVAPLWSRWIWALGGLLTILVSYEEFRKRLVKYSEPEKWSDVIPQVRTLYERFSQGEFAYAPIDLVGYSLLPVYMPLHWMPAGLGFLLHIDIRWIGFGFMALTAALYGWFLAKQPGRTWKKIVALVLPSIPLWAYVLFSGIDLMVTYEIVIGAYYLLLASGLWARRLWLVVLAIILCLLSRYTIIFWLPLFALVLFYEKGWKKSLLVWGLVATCFILIYIIPFYSKDPAILNRGLSYYMGATVAEWMGYGDPPVSYTLEHGINFAPIVKATFSGEMASRVHWARLIQGACLLLLFAGSIWSYRRWRNRINNYTFCLIGLYSFMFIYYFFAPLTYIYYLFPFLVVSAVLCGKIILHSSYNTNKLNEHQ